MVVLWIQKTYGIKFADCSDFPINFYPKKGVRTFLNLLQIFFGKYTWTDLQEDWDGLNSIFSFFLKFNIEAKFKMTLPEMSGDSLKLFGISNPI